MYPREEYFGIHLGLWFPTSRDALTSFVDDMKAAGIVIDDVVIAKTLLEVTTLTDWRDRETEG